MKIRKLKIMLVLVLTICMAISLSACGNGKPEEDVLKSLIISELGDDVQLKELKTDSFESEENKGTAICTAKYEKDNVSIEKVFTIECTKQDGKWVAEKISNKELKNATPLSGVDEEQFTQNLEGWEVKVEEHNTDLGGLTDELTIMKTQESNGAKTTIKTKKGFVFKGENWEETSSDEILNTVEPTRGVLDEDVLNGNESGEITEHQTDLENKKDNITIEQVQENNFFKKIITTNIQYEFKDSSWTEVSSEATEKIEDINLIGSWTGKENVTSAFDAEVNGTYDFVLTITELGTGGELKGEIQSRIGTFNFESKLEKDDVVFFTTSYSGYDIKIETGSDNGKLKVWAWNYGGINDPAIEIDGLVKEN